MISAAFLTIAIGSVLLVGGVLGALGAYWFMVHYCRNNPQTFVAFFVSGLAALAERFGRSHLHFLDEAGAPVVLTVANVASSIQVELETWIDHHRRGLR